ncbi:hypothetical protein MNBD_ACTINO01-1203 [hydrothermal vent metagenome]|uniref:Heme A synthase, cytochrome oxidase biogenesis protein Cox15-CtaA n=2 Tax=hydrothermal vent metagenome TaxID=652676 RepID=A0A3B0RQP4_9ZZZZ
MSSTQELPTTQRTQPVRRFKTVELALAGLIVVAIFIQSVLAGQHLVFDAPIVLHGIIGSTVFLFQAIVIILVFMDRTSMEHKVTAIVIFGLLFAQIGLGYASRTGGSSLVAMHIPLGIVLFGASTWQLAILRLK